MIRRLTATLLALAVTPLGAAHIPDLLLHPSTPLDGEWKTIIDPYESGFYDYRWSQRDLSPNPGRSEAFFLDARPADPAERIEYDFETSPSLAVPGDWNTQKAELFYYEGSIWYRKTFDDPGAADGRRAFLRFGAANYRADAYLNGRKLGSHTGGFTPFSFEATKLLRKGSNSLVVRVDNKRSREAVPTLNTDWWNYGGLTRSVTLVRTPAVFIAEHVVRLESEEDKVITGHVRLSDPVAGLEVMVSIAGVKEGVVVKTDANGHAEFRIDAPALALWSPENPVLHPLTLRCGASEVAEKVGFRTVRARGREILLNGKPIFLRGICIHEEHPFQGGGRVNSPEKARELLALAKELGCNFVRLAHYPHSEAMTRLADEMGLLVWSEVPVYWTIDFTNPDTARNAASQLEDNIRRDINRASIIIWSVANETPVKPERTKFLTHLVARARELDGTRLISAAMEKHYEKGSDNVCVVEDPLAGALDVVSFNQYVGWYDGLPEKCDRVSWRIPYDKPVIVSEFGGDARAGRHGGAGERWTEEFQEDLYRRTLPMLERIDGLAGIAPWILVDFRSPKRLLPGVQDGFNRKGLVSSDGKRKKAFAVMQEYYRKKAGAPEAGK